MKQKLLNKLWLRVGMIVAIMTTALAGTVKAEVSSATPEDGKSYVVAAYVNNKYYALPNQTSNGSTLVGTEVTLNSSNKVNTSDASGKTWTLEEGSTSGQFYIKYTSGSTTNYLYKNGTGGSNYNFKVSATSKNYWSFTTNGTGYTVAAIDRGTNHVNIQCNEGTFRCNNTATPIILLEIGDASGGDTPTTYTVTYNANGGSGTMTDTNSPYASGAEVTVLDNAFTRDGYDFVKWNTASDGTGIDYAEGATFTISDNTTLYAQWTANGGGGDETGTTVTFTPGTDKGETSVTKDGVTVTMSTMNNDSYYQIYAGQSGVFSCSNGATITKIEFTCTASGTSKYGPGNASASVGSYSYSGSTGTWTGSASSVTISSTAQVRMSSLTITYALPSGTATTTTISASGITNTDVYVSTTAGTLTATVTPEGESALSNPAINWSSSDTGVATIDANGAVTLVAAGSTTITASYAGDATYAASSGTYTLTVTSTEPDYATLPFNWAGGTYEELVAVLGVTGHSLSDYGDTHAPYRVQFNADGDYIQIKTDSQPGKVTIGVKMIGGANTSTITVQQSADGETFTNVQALTISGAQNSIHTLETTAAFATATRYVRLYFTKGSNVGVGPITIAKPSTDPVINADASVELTAEKTSGEIAYTISNPVGGTSLTAAENPDVDWISDVTVANDKVTFTTTVNNGSERTATITLTYGSVTKDVTVTQAEHIDINTYTLASAITSGKHYVIAATTSTKTVAMGGKNASKDYYDAVDASLSGETLSVASNSGVQEFVIYGPDPEGFYTIYDPVAGGYLYASSDSSNDLSIQTDNDDNGRWEIDFTNETVTAQGTNSHNLLRYNSSNPRFSCYASGQTVVKFYEKDGEATPTESKTLNASGYATYCSENALDFTGNSDVTAWVITAANSTTGVITFSQIEGKVPAGTGMLLKGSASASVNITSATGTVAAPSPNLLEGTLASKEVAADEYYGLSGNEFVKVNAGTVPAGKALLPASALGGSGVKAFTFVFEDDATGISLMEDGRSQMEDGVIYNVAGQRISKMQKGINIVNGKKILK